jgi:hypothetical protein
VAKTPVVICALRADAGTARAATASTTMTMSPLFRISTSFASGFGETDEQLRLSGDSVSMSPDVRR